MQLRRGPPEVRTPGASPPALRVVKAPMGPVRVPRPWSPRRILDNYSLRVVAGAMLVSVPTAVLLGFVMANWSAQTTIDQAKQAAQATAQSSAVRINDWVAERKAEIRGIAQGNVGELNKPGLNARLLASVPSHPSFDTIEIFDA